MNTTDKTFPVDHRPELDRFQPYKPGFSIAEFKARYGLKKVVKLASNENPLGPSPMAIKAYKAAAPDLFRYPETRSVQLRAAVAERNKVDLSEVVIGAGSDEIIELIAKAFLSPKDSVVVSESSFIQYRSAANLMGARLITVPLNNLRHDVDALAAAADATTRFVFIANPNNPTGTYATRDEMSRFLRLLPPHVVPVIDEAYYEYASTKPDYPSMLEDFLGRRPMIVLRTFSKAYGLAGMRVGYGVAPQACVAAIDRIRPPFNVSVPAQAAAQAALLDVKHVKKTVAVNEKERALLEKTLYEMGFEVVPSAANFILFRVAPRTGRAVFEALLPRGIIARAVDEYGLNEYLRVSVGLPAENKLFVSALREVVKTI